ncbi:MAG: hypothetical protein H0V55_08190 [Thermoleophilaceae bacterium]|nr:hypothetical protein [Thermoleophilaceae bacterium]
MGVRSAITGALTLRGFLAVLTTGLKSFVSDFNLDMLERLLDLAEQHRVLDDLVGLLGEGVERVEDCWLVRSLPGLRPAEVAVAAVGVEVEVGQRLTAQPALVERPAELERVAEPPPPEHGAHGLLVVAGAVLQGHEVVEQEAVQREVAEGVVGRRSRIGKPRPLSACASRRFWKALQSCS